MGNSLNNRKVVYQGSLTDRHHLNTFSNSHGLNTGVMTRQIIVSFDKTSSIII
jgi:hypothetical protein